MKFVLISERSILEGIAQSTVNVNIEPFQCKAMGNEVGEKWTSWLRHFKLMLSIKQINDTAMKKSMLLYTAGTQVQEIFFALPEEESTTESDEFETMVRVLSEHFVKKRNVTFERHIFRGLQQGPTEKIESFVLRLRQQAQKCNFANQLEDNVKDQMIEKCLSAELKTKILDRGDELSLAQSVRLAMTHETIIEQLSAMKSVGNMMMSSSSELKVNKIEAKRARSSGNCRNCGGRGHNGGDKCPAKLRKCFKCNKSGHFASKCYQKDNIATGVSKRSANNGPPEKQQREDNVQSVSSARTSKSDYIFCVESEDRKKENENEVCAIIGGVKVTAVVDSGSTFNLIDIDSWQRLKRNDIQVEK